jgi:hypothetical protein
MGQALNTRDIPMRQINQLPFYGEKDKKSLNNSYTFSGAKSFEDKLSKIIVGKRRW